MPKSTPNVKVQRVREYGARVILHGQDFSEAADECIVLHKKNL